MHEIKGNQEHSGFIVPETGEFGFEVFDNNAVYDPYKGQPELRHAHHKGRQRETDRHHHQAQKIGLVEIGSYGSPRRHHLPLKMLWYSSLPLVFSKISQARFRSGSSLREAMMRPFW